MLRRGALAIAGVALAAALGWHAGAAAQAAPAELRFGVLPVGGVVESRESWTPLLAELSRALGRPVTVHSATTYEALGEAIRRRQVDLSLLSAQLALDAVTQRRMVVLAQVERHGGTPDHRAVLLVRKDGPSDPLADLLARPEQWRLARGDSRSVSGFILPQVQLFLPNRIAMETRFKSEIVGTHQTTALAVANGDADVATNNTTDFERFRAQFPAEAERLQVIWQSEPTPPAQVLVRSDVPPELQKKLRAFLVGYGRGRGPRAEAQREVLKSLRASLGYAAADNKALLPAARLQYQLARQSALNAQWVSEAARQARLQRIETAYAEQVAALQD
ncbi:phosphate/phosphite/phosphonate ABC transporter substrate-binding protein [Variovorax ginsengisoli]|uniref:Phosphate/phosphite/phosphonate ABC transporter substrate-binding protein n=1 Tax=Variovorax ginsengisoli TaxID=363844 RepID=A0ABT8S4M5_9BURK|nr:phosphate/phosphite/phosphonate ABC transporter substrate-binding protein [Variovorax ginsengisoli]MDN8614704.1 phosphate/phosphite/phosphonate ABC transporter substrate-binding protein [Variovorax ginsengisoli]MDO1533874.1 phosphate/phosphite/phosphonate ABC transporter substrate-binding protein [Variovorax ginsengisoli]